MAKFKGNPRAAKKAQEAKQESQQTVPELVEGPSSQSAEALDVAGPVASTKNSSRSGGNTPRSLNDFSEAPPAPAATVPERRPELVEGPVEGPSEQLIRHSEQSEELQDSGVIDFADIAKKRAEGKSGVTSGNPRAKSRAAQSVLADASGGATGSAAEGTAGSAQGLGASVLQSDPRDLPPETVGQIQVDAERIKAQAARAAAARENLNAKDVKKTYAQKKEDKKREREERKAARLGKKANKLKIFLIVLLSLVVVGGAGGAYVMMTDVIEIQNVEYVGADHLTEAECEALTTLGSTESPIGQNLLVFDGAGITNNFKSDAWVKNVTFNRVFPHTLQIVVEEKQIAAYVEFASGSSQIEQCWILSTDGTWIMGVPDQESDTGKQLSSKIYEDSDNYLHIKDCPNGIAPVIGATCTDETVLNALSIINGFTTDLQDQVKTITASSVSATTLVLTNNVEIAFGEATDIRDKERIAKEIMEQNDKVVYINVRSIDRPTWRSAS